MGNWAGNISQVYQQFLVMDKGEIPSPFVAANTSPISANSSVSEPQNDTFTKHAENPQEKPEKNKKQGFEKNIVFNSTSLKILSPITPFRRVSTLPENVDQGNYVRAAGIGILALNFLPRISGI